MTEEELKQVLIDHYINLLRIKAAEKGTNKELELQLRTMKIKLSSFHIEVEEIENMMMEE